jgi:hypothetical protein
MSSQRYRVHRVTVLPLAKFGATLGAAALLVPSLICALVGTQLVAFLRLLLEQWQRSQVDALGMGVPVEFDFIQLLGLETVQSWLIRLDDQRLTVILIIVLGSMILGGLLIAFTVLLLGWLYNLIAALSGGLELELRPPGGGPVRRA